MSEPKGKNNTISPCSSHTLSLFLLHVPIAYLALHLHGQSHLHSLTMSTTQPGMFQCGSCKKNYKRLDHLARHVRSRTFASSIIHFT